MFDKELSIIANRLKLENIETSLILGYENCFKASCGMNFFQV